MTFRCAPVLTDCAVSRERKFLLVTAAEHPGALA
jgi:hypothetical protein